MPARKFRAVLSYRVAMARNCLSLAKKFSMRWRLVEVAVERAVLASVRLGWNDGGLAGSSQRCPDALVSVERLVGDQLVGLHRREKVVGADEVMSLAAAEEEADRIAERIDHGMDLGAQPSARGPIAWSAWPGSEVLP